MSLSQIISISITRNTASAERASFGIPLFVTETVPVGFTERTRSYSALEDLTDDGFAITDEAYIAAQSFFAQNPNVSEFIVGRKDVGDASWVAALTAISAENDSWYVLTTESRTKADILAMAAYIEARTKLYFVCTAETPSIDSTFSTGVSTDTAAELKDLNYDRTVHYWHQDAATKYYECAYAGHNLPFTAGSATWAYLQLSGVPQALNTDGNPLTTTQVNNLRARSSTFSQTLAGVTVTRDGVTVSGEYIDIIRGTDALEEDMEKRLFDLLINQQGGKVPYDDSGLNTVRGVITDVLNRFVNSNFITPNFKISIPRAKDISAVDKSNRILNNVTFDAYYVSAIHELNVSGNITFE